MRTNRCLLASMLVLFAATAQAARDVDAGADDLRGTVFVDSNGDGERNADESGLAGVKVSNGREIALTNADGRYALPLRDGDTIFVIKPAGMDLPRRADGMPAFWKHHFPQGSPPLRYGGIAPTRIENGDFAVRLVAREATQFLDALVFGDPQPKSTQDVDFYSRDIVSTLEAAPQAQLGLSLGDIVSDDLSLYPAMSRATERLGVPWLHLPGNHDLDFDAKGDADSLLSYRAVFGPDTYAWEERLAAFILLDDVIYQPGTAAGYIGGLRDDQFAFLEAYLTNVPSEHRIVIGSHIPFHDGTTGRESFRRADRERLFALLARFENVLLLTSHAHVQRHYFHTTADGWHGAQPLHEYVVGAACGGFWSGVLDVDGIPDSRMADGTPNGYARLRVSDNDYHLRWHVARDPADTRIAVHAPRVLRRGAYPAFTVTANVYMGMDDTRVEYRIDAGAWRAMTRATHPDPALLAINVVDDRADTLRAYDRAVEAVPSTHLWRGALPTDLAVGEHQVEVRAFDRWDGELRAGLSYRLEEFRVEK